MKSMTSLIILFGMASICRLENIAAAAPITITTFSAPIEVCAIDDKDCHAMTETTELQQGQKVRILAGGSLSIRLEDGSTMSLTGNKMLLIKVLSRSSSTSGLDIDLEILSLQHQAEQERKGTPRLVTKQKRHGAPPSSPQP